MSKTYSPESVKYDLVYRYLKRIFTSMGAPGLRFHDLRYPDAVFSLRSGCDIKTVQENPVAIAATGFILGMPEVAMK